MLLYLIAVNWVGNYAKLADKTFGPPVVNACTFHGSKTVKMTDYTDRHGRLCGGSLRGYGWRWGSSGFFGFAQDDYYIVNNINK